MSNVSAHSFIRLRGVRQNNLKNFDLDLPLHRLIVITGVSGSGKSSLAFDTLFAEGQRRYIETFSPYARQFFDRMDKPQVDSIEGIPPAIAIEQRNTVKTTRSTVGTMTEICDYLKLLWPQIAQLYCRQCGRAVHKESPQQIWGTISTGRTSSTSSPTIPVASRLTGKNRDNVEVVPPKQEVLITFDLPLSEKLSLDESLALIAKQGYQRLLVESKTASTAFAAGFSLRECAGPLTVSSRPGAGAIVNEYEIIRLEDATSLWREQKPASLTVVQDRLKFSPDNRARFVEACEQAYHFGKGRLTIHELNPEPAYRSTLTPSHSQRFSHRFHCAQCDIDYREPSPALFSFNHPLGACPACRGFGRIITINYDLTIPDRSRTLAESAVKPWQTGQGQECQDDMMRFCKKRGVPTDVPFDRLSRKWQDWVLEGDPGYGQDSAHEWPRAWYGIKGYFRWLESKAYKMHVRVLLSRYRAYLTCPDCRGARLKPEALLYKLMIGDWRSTPESVSAAALSTAGASIANRQSPITLADFYRLPIRDALACIAALRAKHRPQPGDPLGLVLDEVRSRLGYLVEIGLGYLTLDRATRTLSGGETARVNLTTCLGSRLVNTLYVLDEPSVGLHPRDTARLVKVLQGLRDLGNTVLVVEHEPGVIRAADQIVDLGPGHGESGGYVVFQGAGSEAMKSKASLTGQYLAGKRWVEIPPRREVDLSAIPKLELRHAALHNLKDLAVEVPLGRFVCVAGVSGSGKTTLVREVLLPALEARLKSQISILNPAGGRVTPADGNRDEDEPLVVGQRPAATLAGWEHLGRAVLVDQSILGKTPRSNPAVYIGAFDDIRELFAQSESAQQRGLNASAFSFNSREGQCERCRGAGFEKIEMQFLSDVFIRCPDCNGLRYRQHILEVKVEGRASRGERRSSQGRRSTLDSGLSTVRWSIADLLEATVDEVIGFLEKFPDSRPAQRAAQGLKLLQEVGLGYLRVGQPINTLSGGESQRLKLVSHLAECGVESRESGGESRRARVEGRGHEPDAPEEAPPSTLDPRPSTAPKPTLFLFDEPTTGLHFDDVRVLLKVFQRLVDAGHSVLVIEHNLDVIKCADWVIDLGPDAGDEGGRIVAQGTPEQVAACPDSHTGEALTPVLQARARRSGGPMQRAKN